MKHEWRKHEKELYLPKTEPEYIDVPEFKFLTISGQGNPNAPEFANYIQALYPFAYGIKMGLKKDAKPPKGYQEYTVYPLEGIWDVTEQAKKASSAKLNKDELVYTLLIRQPNFVTKEYFEKVREQVLEKKADENPLLREVQFEKSTDGPSVQMMHIGAYDDEPASFARMEAFAEENGLKRLSKVHKEIYLSDFRKVPADKLKTVLRFQVSK